MTSDRTVYAGWQATSVPDMLNGADHFAYVIGYPDGQVKPGAPLPGQRWPPFSSGC